MPSFYSKNGNLMVLPDGVNVQEAALNEPLSCAYNGFTKCFVKPGGAIYCNKEIAIPFLLKS